MKKQPTVEARSNQALRNTPENSRYTFSGKERDNETGYSYFGARYYNSDISIWLSVDPLSDKYPNLTPYAYCANNPIILVDPDGRKIVIKGDNGESITYTANMEYEGDDKFISKKVANYNKIYASKAGAKLLDRLIGSKKTYTMDNKRGKTDEPHAHSSGVHYNGYNEINYDMHELFHNYQYDMNQGGASIENEVEAYLFESIVCKELELPGGALLGMVTPKKDPNSKSFNEIKDSSLGFLLCTEMTEDDFNKNFDNVVKGFKSYSAVNRTGIYNKYPISLPGRKKNLVKDFYPIKSHK